MKKTSLFLLTGLLVFTFILSIHTGPAYAWEWPNMLKIVAHGSESPPYQATIGWGGIMEKQTGMKVRVTPENHGVQRIVNVRTGKHHIGSNSAGDASYCVMGMSSYATRDSGPHQMRAVWLLETVPFGVMVRGDSDIKTLSDLKPGVRFAVPPGPAPLSDVYGVAAWAGLKKEDVETIHFGDMESAIRAVPEGKVDCVWWTPAAGISFEMVGTPHSVRWLDMDPDKDPEGAARALKEKPLWDFFEAPSMVAKPAVGVKMNRMVTYYFGTEKMDSALAYNLAKWFDENFDAYKGAHPACGSMNAKTFRYILDTTPFPIHEGVIKYLKEKGIWTAKDDERQDYNLKLVNRYETAYNAAISKADANKIKVSPANQKWMDLWAEHKKGIPSFETVTEVH